MDCEICHGEGWVCENHPDVVWAGGKAKCCVGSGYDCGAGMPCKCNISNPPWHHLAPREKVLQ